MIYMEMTILMATRIKNKKGGRACQLILNFPFISSNCWISLKLFIKIWCNKKNVCLQLNTSSSNDAATSWITIELKACSWHRICMSASTLEIIKLEICYQNWNRFFLKKIRLEALKQQSSVQNECNYTLKVTYKNLDAFLVETAGRILSTCR